MPGKKTKELREAIPEAQRQYLEADIASLKERVEDSRRKNGFVSIDLIDELIAMIDKLMPSPF